jgi:SAM-dependent methyltransferase
MIIFGYLFILIFFLFTSILLIYWVHQLYYGIFTDRVVFLPASLKKIDKTLLEIIPKYITDTKKTTFVELGCGKGDVIKFLANNFEWQKLIGIELDFVSNFVAKLFVNKPNVEIIQKDIFAYKIPTNSVVFCFLGTEVLDKLHQKGQFDNNLVISLEFALGETEPTEKFELPGFSFQKHIYVYDFRK